MSTPQERTGLFKTPRPRRGVRSVGSRVTRLIVAIAGIAALAAGLYQLQNATVGVTATKKTVGTTPVTIFQPRDARPAPVVVIAHGFAGSQQLMQPFAVTLARNGYIAVTFDFLGHGRNPVAMRGDITEGLTITSALLRELGEVAAYAVKLPASDGRLAALGHSMASDIVVRFGQSHPDVQATVAVSVFSPVVTAASPRNLLVIVGALEPAMLINEGLRIVNLTADGKATAGETYGKFADGTARRLVLARNVEHIGVLYGEDSMTASLRWLNSTFGKQSDDSIDRRGLSIALTLLGLIALAWPLTQLLPVATRIPLGANLPWKPLLIAALAPAVLTPLILWKLPTDFLPILLGDYLALHFAVYGLLTTAAISWLRTSAPQNRPANAEASNRMTVGVAAAMLGIYQIAGFGYPIDSYIFAFYPIAPRIPLMAAIACGTLIYFIADEWLTRGAQAKRSAYAITKFCFLLSLAIAVALNPQKLFFLIIIVPAILMLFVAFGLISRWSYRQTRHPLPAALANATVFAWAIAVTFPLIAR